MPSPPILFVDIGNKPGSISALGHAWERFNLDDAARQRFELAVEAPTWKGEDTPHDRRAIEMVADAMAHGLLTAPLVLDPIRQRQLDRFEMLTGSASPRLDTINSLDNSAG